jgi:hypothetical protein
MAVPREGSAFDLIVAPTSRTIARLVRICSKWVEPGLN